MKTIRKYAPSLNYVRDRQPASSTILSDRRGTSADPSRCIIVVIDTFGNGHVTNAAGDTVSGAYDS